MTAPGPNGATVDMAHADETYGIRSYGPSMVAALNLPLVELSEDEESLFDRLVALVASKRFGLQLRDTYYRGTTRLQDLGISIPPQMRQLHIAMGWPRVAVDALNSRLNVDGFRYPGSDDVDRDLESIWLGNDMDAEHPLTNLDALVFGDGFVSAGVAPTGPNVIDAPPLLAVESPLDIGVEWDARTRSMTAAVRLFGFEGSRQATLYLPDQTIHLIDDGGWTVVGRDMHRLGRVLVERFANRPRSYARDGASEITPELMSLTDQGCRALIGLAVAGEFYSAPQRYILGAEESAFQNSDGTPKSAWETYLGRIVALERDEDGNVPDVGQFTAYDPSVFTKVIDSLAQRVSSLTCLPMHVLGFATANPASADAIRSAEMELTRRADHKTVALGKSWRNVIKLALLVRDGRMPPNAEKITTVWSSTATPTIASTTDAIFKQVTMGYLPYASDVVGERLGYSAAERERIAADRARDPGASFLNYVSHAVLGKDLRVDNALATYAEPAAPPTPGAPPPTSPAMPAKMPPPM